MILCKYCGFENNDDAVLCEGCGRSLLEAEEPGEAETVAILTPADEAEEINPAAPETEPEASAEEFAEEAAEEPAEELPEEEAPAGQIADEKPKAKKSVNPLYILVALVAAAIVLLVVLLEKQANPKAEAETAAETAVESAETDSTETAEAAETEETAEPAEDVEGGFFTIDETRLTEEVRQTVVASCGDLTVTNAVLPYYFWDSFFALVENYYLYYYIDVYGNLDSQMYDETESWASYLMDYTMNYIGLYGGLYTRAKAEGFELSGEYQDSLDTLESDIAEYAQNNGYGTMEDYLVMEYGPGATFEGYYAYQEQILLAVSYWNTVMDNVSASDAEIDAYWEEHSEELIANGLEKIDLPNVNVRHILICPEEVTLTEEDEGYEAAVQAAKDAAKAKAEELYQQWKSGEATEDSFAALANENSEDPGSNTTGGLYEDVYPGEMVETFNDWCFDASRAAGDSGIVETDYGYHIMFFSGVTDTVYWKECVKDEIAYEYSSALQSELAETYPLDWDSSAILLYAANIEG